jgi:glycosyltransferase involved in cell wall biosynthesis
MRQFFDCIIPFYNEGNRICDVVGAVKKVSSVSRIICVDDGSTDDASSILQKRFPDIILQKLQKHIGKSGAVFAGLTHVHTKNVVLLDGDLIGLNPKEIDRACTIFDKNESLDMLILRVHGEHRFQWIDDIFRNYIIQSGNRILRTSDLKEVQKLHPKGYQLEVAINQYMIDTKRRVIWFALSAMNLHKTHKTSWIDGWKKDILMDQEITHYLGLYKRIKQILFFCREKII